MAANKKEEEGPRNPFTNLEKAVVLQEARAFNEVPIKVKKCITTLTKLLFLIYQGETFGTREATETFFSMTKLFQNKDPTMRRVMYLTIKAMASISEDVIMVTSSLMKDMTDKDDTFRAPAIRALCTITDNTTLQSLERYLKQAIVDRNANVASAALVSSLHMMRNGQELVKRWVNEVQQAVSSHAGMTQYHALGLLYHIKQKDRLAVQKLVGGYLNHSLRSNYANVVLIRYASKLLEQEDNPATFDAIYNFLEGSMRHKSDVRAGKH